MWNRMYELGKKGYFPQGVAALNHTQSQMQVLQNKAAMVSTGDWVGNEMKDSTPDGFKWGYMAIPGSNNPSDPIYVRTGLADVNLMIWAKKPDLTKAWAKEFYLFLFNAEVQAYLSENAGVITTRKDINEDSEHMAKLPQILGAVQSYMQQNIVVAETYKREVDISSPLMGKADELIEQLITAVATGKKDPLPVLKEAEQLLEKAINEK